MKEVTLTGKDTLSIKGIVAHENLPDYHISIGTSENYVQIFKDGVVSVTIAKDVFISAMMYLFPRTAPNVTVNMCTIYESIGYKDINLDESSNELMKRISEAVEKAIVKSEL